MNYHCLICDSKNSCHLIASTVSDSKCYTIAKCEECEGTFSFPRPDGQELDRIYSDFEMTRCDLKTGSKIQGLYQRTIDYLRSEMDSRKKLKFLDYGFGTGEFLKQIVKNGIEAYGVEVDNERCRQLQTYCKEKNVKIQCLDLRNESIAKFSGMQFDCITLFQVIEHVVDPLKLLTGLSKFQAPGQFLFIECPNNDALFLKIKNLIRNFVGRESFYDSLRPPIHINGFNKKSLHRMLEKTDYSTIKIEDYRCVDGVHQPENMFMYPTFFEILMNKKRWTLDNFFRCSIRYLDLFAKSMGAGYGLYALARKN